MAWTRVKNQKGDLRCHTCPSWLRHWENGTNQIALMCGAYGCRNLDLSGAHVIKVSDFELVTYVVPICTRCIAWTGEFDVLWDLVPIGRSHACSSDVQKQALCSISEAAARGFRKTLDTYARVGAIEWHSNL